MVDEDGELLVDLGSPNQLIVVENEDDRLGEFGDLVCEHGQSIVDHLGSGRVSAGAGARSDVGSTPRGASTT